MKKRVCLNLFCVVMLGISVFLSGCGKEADEGTEAPATVSTTTAEEPGAGKYDAINKARAMDVESAKMISQAVYDVLTDEKIFDEVYASLDGTILAWAKEGQMFEDGGAGHERFLMALNNHVKLSGGAPMLQYKEQLIGTGNFVPGCWAIAYANGKVEVYVVRDIISSAVKDYTDKVQVYPDTDDNYKEKVDTGDVYREAKDADLRSAGDIAVALTSSMSSEAAYEEVAAELDSGKILAWAKAGEAFENGGTGYGTFVKELNESLKYKGGVPALQYKEEIQGKVTFVPAGWAVAFRDHKPVVYITDGTMTADTVDSTPMIEMQPDVDVNYR